ncbi:hypothetical protein ARTHRO9V_220001 [Arthrobacter sp. 9V]|nr:hypothetical protein ARTHRO9V_220001 [Arthrobacter sp. 9V]
MPTTHVPGACSTARDHGSADALAFEARGCEAAVGVAVPVAAAGVAVAVLGVAGAGVEVRLADGAWVAGAGAAGCALPAL